MAREFGMTLTLNGALGGSFKSAFAGAKGQVQSLSRAISQMQKTPTGQLGAQLDRQKAKLRELGASLSAAKGQLGALKAQAQAAGGASGILARQISLAEKSVNRLSASFTRQSAAFRNTIAEARNAGGSVRQLAQDYRHLSAEMDRASKRRGALMANQNAIAANKSQRGELQGQLLSSAASAMTVAMPAKLAIDFEHGMARVGAVSQASAEDMAQLTAQARQLGRDTQFSATEAAQGMQYLAMAGFKTNQIAAAMPGTLNLAAAAGSDLGTTCDIASDMLSAFGMKAEQMDYVGDVLVKTFTSSNSTLESLGQTMKYVGPVAKTVGASIGDTAAMAGLLHNVGIKATQAGTAMRAGFLRLAAPPKMAKDALGDLTGATGAELDELYEMCEGAADAEDALKSIGMSTKDASGNLRPMADILEELNMRTKNMGSGDKAEIFKKVFGTEASSAFMALAEQASKTVDEHGNRIVDSLGRPTTALRKYMEEVNSAHGNAAKVATQMNATTRGALTRMKSAWEDAGIAIGNMFMPAISSVAGMLSSVANGISKFTERFPTLSKGIALAVGGLMTLSIATTAARLAFLFMSGGLLSLQKGFLLFTGAAKFLGGALTTLRSGFIAAGTGARIFGISVKSALIGTGVGAAIVGLGLAMEYLYNNWETIGPKLASFFEPVVSGISSAWGTVTDIAAGVVTFFRNIGPNLYSALKPSIDRISNAFGRAAEFCKGVWNTVSSAASQAWNTISSAASQAWDWISSKAAAVANFVSSLWSGTGNFLSGIWDSISDSAVAAWDWISESALGVANWIQGAWATVGNYLSGIWGGISNAAASAWQGIASSCEPVVNWLTETWNTVSGWMQTIWDGVVSAADVCWQGITSVFSPAIEFFSGVCDGIRSVFDALFGWLREGFEWVMGVIGDIKSFVGDIIGGTSDAVSKTMGEAKGATESHAANRVMSGDGRHRNSAQKQAQLAKSKKPPTIASPEKPKGAAQYTPGPAPAGATPKGSKHGGGGGGGGRKSSGAGAGNGSSVSAAGAGGGTTIVRLAGDNKNFSTQFIPAGMSTGTSKRISAAADGSAPSMASSGAGRRTVSQGASGGSSPARASVAQPSEIGLSNQKPIPVFVTNFPGAEKNKPESELSSQIAAQTAAPAVSQPIPTLSEAARPEPKRPAKVEEKAPRTIQPSSPQFTALEQKPNASLSATADSMVKAMASGQKPKESFDLGAMADLAASFGITPDQLLIQNQLPAFSVPAPTVISQQNPFMANAFKNAGIAVEPQTALEFDEARLAKAMQDTSEFDALFKQAMSTMPAVPTILSQPAPAISTPEPVVISQQANLAASASAPIQQMEHPDIEVSEEILEGGIQSAQPQAPVMPRGFFRMPQLPVQPETFVRAMMPDAVSAFVTNFPKQKTQAAPSVNVPQPTVISQQLQPKSERGRALQPVQPTISAPKPTVIQQPAPSVIMPRQPQAQPGKAVAPQTVQATMPGAVSATVTNFPKQKAQATPLIVEQKASPMVAQQSPTLARGTREPQKSKVSSFLGSLLEGAQDFAGSLKDSVGGLWNQATSALGAIPRTFGGMLGSMAGAILPGGLRGPQSMPSRQQGDVQSQGNVVNVNFNSQVSVGSGINPDDVRSRMRAIEPDIHRLVKRALGDLQAQSRRTAYVQ